ncbi:ATP-binding cassette sub-family G member 4-like [Phymastichus coffea]|uniref:ATP-binding cassette sub-family G member 4-like n=1 Tax=Phymastichus coffea TaxID=108790 RepID=UPI00273B866F|nr:ATP-binding cassette sub-family G member 4-like [Phymastichus coffea]XP_058805823.1 ATP-binding cassette sub-family G member 4-like [Phymastichus coffea]XP_058805825.1 ATP-binding cassette sub-family G member 4-like [Phymastichus coffea]
MEIPTGTTKTKRSFISSVGLKLDLELAKIHKNITGPSPIKTSNTPVGVNQLNLTFDALSYYVQTGFFKKEKKRVLSNVCGDFRPGELTAIIGPSGAGKSTLMDILAGFTTSGVTGDIRVNGRGRNLAAFRRSSAYIMQDDNLQLLLTVQESMSVAANLKLGPETPEVDKQHGIDIILREMGLGSARDTRAVDLSGGQKKRLAIALELISNPPMMFFDEPTSGLDSVASRQCVGLLKSLAQEGRTAVCTIHQPSAALFDMIDHLYVVVAGRCAYAGSARNLVPYLASVGLPCPTYHDPADFLLEIVSGDYGDHSPRLIRSSENGKSPLWRSTRTERKKVAPLKLAPKLPLSATPILYECEDRAGSAYHATSSWRQLGLLLRRNAVSLSRDRVLTFMRLTMHLLIALLVGTLCYQTGQDAARALDNFNLLFFSLLFLMFNALTTTIITFPAELPSLMREHFNRWYKLRSFYIANRFADLPVQIAAVSIYTLVMYFMTGQMLESKRVAMFILICVLVSLIAQVIGIIAGCSLGIQTAPIFGPFTILPYVIFSGFFVHLNDAPSWLQWLFHVSFLKYGFEGVMIAIYGNNRPKMQCSEDYCQFCWPRVFLKAVDMEHSDYCFAAAFLFGLYVVLDLSAYFVLRWKLKTRKL